MKKVKSGLVSNVWSSIQMFCSCHEEPVEFELVSNEADFKEPYYRCPCEGCVHHNYMQRITFHDYEILNEKLEAAMSTMGIAFDMANFRFSMSRKEPAKELKIKVIKASGRHIKLGIQ